VKGFVDNVEKLTEDNEVFRKVLYTGHNLQLVLMAIQPGDEIGEEVHDDRDRFFCIEAGTGTIEIDGVAHQLEAGDGIIVPQGARHNVITSGAEA
jgi:mannose-6-phosphate isomerase-like protein (cupin superfamily)